MALKLITVDFWNTLFDSSKGTERNAYRQHVLKTAIKKIGSDISSEGYENAMKASWEYFNRIWINEKRTPLPIETVSFFWEFLKLPIDDNAMNYVADEFANSIMIYQPSLMKGAKEALAKLSKDFKLAIVSDTGFSPGSTIRKLMEELNVYRFFSAFSFSDETGVSKPHPKAFRTVLDLIGAEAGESCHIGDIEQTDIAGSKELGMFAIKFTGDATSSMITPKEDKSIADYVESSWEGIVDKVYKIRDSFSG